MMAMFFAQRVILGKTAFKDVPAKLKDQVRELLVDAGLPELAEEETTGRPAVGDKKRAGRPFFTYREIARRLPARIRL